MTLCRRNNAELWYGIGSGDMNVIKRAKAKGADVNSVAENGLRPIHIAVAHCDDALAGFLLENGADVNAPDKVGKTSYHYYCQNLEEYKHAGILEEMLAHGLDMMKRDNDGRRGFDLLNWETLRDMGWCISLRRQEGGEYAIPAANEPEKLNKSLQEMVCFSQHEEVEKLLKAGANVNYKNAAGENTWHLACQLMAKYPRWPSLFEELYHSLWEAGVDVEAKDKNGCTGWDYLSEETAKDLKRYIHRYHPAYQKKPKCLQRRKAQVQQSIDYLRQ